MEEERSRAFSVEDALEMVLIFDGTGIITYANSAAREKLGYGGPVTGPAGRHISDIFPNVFRRSEDGFETDYEFGRETRQIVMYRKNLTCFPAEARISESGGCPGSYICMACDILEREHLAREIVRVREEAQRAAAVKSEFVANVTHELRTPVNGISGNVRELLSEVSEERTLKTLRLIERCCGDMNKIIDNILDFSKLEAGKFTLEPRKFRFRAMLDYVKAQHGSKITEKGLDFFMTVSPQVPEYVVGDELRIVQILNNLLSNALKFTSVGEITVEVIRTARVEDRTELFFIVSDTGIGIAGEDRGKLFKSFTQADASISRKYGGTGLGLSICKQLTELMGGRIGVESREGGGSIFSFSVWVETCGEENAPEVSDDVAEAFRRTGFPAKASAEKPEAVREYGTPENVKALQKNLSKLILCVEMENWEKAEMFVETLGRLTEGAPADVKRGVLRLKMAIRKEDYEKTAAECDMISGSLEAGGEQT